MTDKTEPSGIVLPDDRKLAAQMLDLEYSSRAMEKGWMGRFFGSGIEKAGNIAGFAVTASFTLFVIVLLWMPDNPSLTKKDALLIVASFISLSLGFLFGRTTS